MRRPIIGQVTFYEDRSIMGVDSEAEHTGRVEDAIDFFSTPDERVTVTDRIPEGSVSSVHFLLDPPVTLDEFKRFTEYCHKTWDENNPEVSGVLNTPMDRDSRSLGTIAVQH